MRVHRAAYRCDDARQGRAEDRSRDPEDRRDYCGGHGGQRAGHDLNEAQLGALSLCGAAVAVVWVRHCKAVPGILWCC